MANLRNIKINLSKKDCDDLDAAAKDMSVDSINKWTRSSCIRLAVKNLMQIRSGSYVMIAKSDYDRLVSTLQRKEACNA